MTILEALQQLSEKKISSFELTQATVARIRELNPAYNAFLTLFMRQPFQLAQQLDEERAQGQLRGPLHGVVVAVKDVFCMKGTKTTCGSKLFADHVTDYDAAVVEKLQDAGAIIVGKTGMHELAYGVTSNNPHFGPVRNPWDTSRIPGGSSGGSGAAVASGMVPMAMGSDTGGSIRLPAAFCGTVGLKPTTGRVSRRGVMPLDFSLDHMGPLTQTVRDAALVLQVLAGYDPADDSSSKAKVADYVPGEKISLAGIRVGIPNQFFYERTDPEILDSVTALHQLAERLGATLHGVDMPDMPAITAIGRVILMAEASAAMSKFVHEREKFGTDVLSLLDQGRLIPATDYVQAQRLRRIYQREFARVWNEVDVLLTPTSPCFPAKIGETEIRIGDQIDDVRLASTRFIRGLNVVGVPALALPCGISKAGLPISAQIIGKPFDEKTVLLVGAAFEDALNFQANKPPQPPKPAAA